MTAPIRREILVTATPVRAFAAFTEEIGQWWPLDTHAVFGDGTVAFEEGRLVERSGDQVSVWGEVLIWSAPHELALTWHPGGEPDEATRVTVTFDDHPEGTLVTLLHEGWELDDEERAGYETGWPGVLASYAETAAG